MSAPARTPFAPSRAGASRRTAPTRLPWWGVLLPVLAFAALLVLPVTSDDGAPAVDATPITDVMERLQQAMSGA